MLKLGERVLRRVRHASYKGTLEARAHGEQEAERLVEEGLRAAGLRKEQLRDLPGSDLRKMALAEVVWSRTTVDLGWISQRLEMRSASNVSQQIRRFKQAENSRLAAGKIRKKLPKQFVEWFNLSRFLAYRSIEGIEGLPRRSRLAIDLQN